MPGSRHDVTNIVTDTQQRVTRDLLSHVDVREMKKVIDVGCGSGISTSELKKRYDTAHVIGIDGASYELEKAKAALPACEFMHSDITHDLPALKQDFDLVFCSSYLHMFSNHTVILEELCSLLKDGGDIAVQIPIYDGQPIIHAVMDTVSDLRWSSRLISIDMFKRLSVSEYIDILTGLLSSFSIWTTTRYLVMPGIADIMSWYRMAIFDRYFEFLSLDERADFEERVSSAISQNFAVTHGGGLVLPVDGIYFVGKR